MEFIKPKFVVYSIESTWIDVDYIDQQKHVEILVEEDTFETKIEALQRIDELCRNSENSQFTYKEVYESLK